MKGGYLADGNPDPRWKQNQVYRQTYAAYAEQKFWLEGRRKWWGMKTVSPEVAFSDMFPENRVYHLYRVEKVG